MHDDVLMCTAIALVDMLLRHGAPGNHQEETYKKESHTTLIQHHIFKPLYYEEVFSENWQVTS